MGMSGVKKQYTKFQILSEILPGKVQEEVKPLLRKSETEFPNNDAYKQLKTRVLQIFGPRPEEAMEKALGRVLTGKPSQLARLLVNDLCQDELDCRCCPKVVLALWQRHLPSAVRAGIASTTFNKANFDEICQLADDIFSTQSASTKAQAYQMSAMSAISSPGSAAASAPSPSPSASLNETQPAIPYPQPEVNAIRGGSARSRGRGRGNGRGGRGRGTSNANQEQRHKGTKHPDLPAGVWRGCAMHFKWGRGSYFCSEPSTCPWKDVYASKPAKQ